MVRDDVKPALARMVNRLVTTFVPSALLDDTGGYQCQIKVISPLETMVLLRTVGQAERRFLVKVSEMTV